MRKQIVLLAKKMTACGLAAAMLFGVGPFDKVTTSKSAAAMSHILICMQILIGQSIGLRKMFI